MNFIFEFEHKYHFSFCFEGKRCGKSCTDAWNFRLTCPCERAWADGMGRIWKCHESCGRRWYHYYSRYALVGFFNLFHFFKLSKLLQYYSSYLSLGSRCNLLIKQFENNIYYFKNFDCKLNLKRIRCHKNTKFIFTKLLILLSILDNCLFLINYLLEKIKNQLCAISNS